MVGPLLLAVAVAAETDATGNAQAAMYAAVSAVLVSLIGGAVAIYTSGRKSAPDTSVRYVDPPTSNELPRELSGLLADALEEARQARDALERAERARDLWEGRARRLGWEDRR